MAAISFGAVSGFSRLCLDTCIMVQWFSGSGLIPAVEDDSTVRSDEGRIQEDRTSFDSLMGAGDGSFHRYCLLRRRREASDGFGTIFMVAA